MKPHVSYLGAFESDLWSRLLPQAAAEEDFARHAVIALGAVNKAAEASQMLVLGRDSSVCEQSSLRHSRCSTIKKHHEASLQHYGKAIALIQGQFSNPTLDARRIQNALVACTLFCSLETAYGGLEAAFHPLQSGVNLLLDFQEDRSKNGLVSASSGSSIIEPDLLDIFLHFESIIYRVKGKTDKRNAIYRIKEDTAALENIPIELSSLRDSRIYLDLIHRRLQESPLRRLRPQEPELYFPVDECHLSPQDGPSSENIEWYRKSISRWQKAFHPLLQKCRADVQNTPNLMAATYLEMRRLLLELDLDHSDSLPNSCPHGVALESCKAIVALAAQILESDEAIVMRGPTIPRYSMLVEEVVSLIFRIADRHNSPSIAQVANDLQNKYA